LGCGSGESSAANAPCPRVDKQVSKRHTGLRVGLNSVWNDNCNLAGITGAGVTAERIELGWSDVEPEPGQWRWNAVDTEFTIAARHGLTVLPVLMSLPGWTGLSADTIPANPSGYANY